MQRLAWGVLVLAFAGLSALYAEDKAKEDAKLDPAKLVGDWKITSGKKMGEEIAAERLASKITWTKDEITIPAGPDQKFVMGYKIDAGKMPAEIDMEIKSGPVPEGKAKGIVSFDGKVFKLCYSVEGMGGDRPKKFESTMDGKEFLFVMEKWKDK